MTMNVTANKNLVKDYYLNSDSTISKVNGNITYNCSKIVYTENQPFITLTNDLQGRNGNNNSGLYYMSDTGLVSLTGDYYGSFEKTYFIEDTIKNYLQFCTIIKNSYAYFKVNTFQVLYGDSHGTTHRFSQYGNIDEYKVVENKNTIDIYFYSKLEIVNHYQVNMNTKIEVNEVNHPTTLKGSGFVRSLSSPD
jgi:hypothetical protein